MKNNSEKSGVFQTKIVGTNVTIAPIVAKCNIIYDLFSLFCIMFFIKTSDRANKITLANNGKNANDIELKPAPILPSVTAKIAPKKPTVLAIIISVCVFSFSNIIAKNDANRGTVKNIVATFSSGRDTSAYVEQNSATQPIVARKICDDDFWISIFFRCFITNGNAVIALNINLKNVISILSNLVPTCLLNAEFNIPENETIIIDKIPIHVFLFSMLNTIIPYLSGAK